MDAGHQRAYLAEVYADALLKARTYDVGKGVQSCLYIDGGERTYTTDLLHYLLQAQLLALGGVGIVERLAGAKSLLRYLALNLKRHHIIGAICITYGRWFGLPYIGDFVCKGR